MPVTTLTAAVHITPVVIKTFLAHSKHKAIKYRDGTDGNEAKDDLIFDQAFHIVKSFIELGINNTVESLQEFTNTRIPVPYWNAVSPVKIPFYSCNKAADHLISWFEPEELKSVVGGERWWQIRGLDGVDAEWITEKEYLHPPAFNEGRNLSQEEHNILKMEHLESVMLYIHGGGYFWGSVNTHRYQISRFARKFKGRAFAVNYRKAPQYPWPCPLHDVLAAYLYLIEPPPGALHRPIHPSKIVVAGDSAGGGLSITLLTILRDLGLPLPAGGVLISPWVDLTHSFPSILENKGDIIPEHGFLAKPSTTWPLDPIPPVGGRVITTTTNPPPKPGYADTLAPTSERVQQGSGSLDPNKPIPLQEEMLKTSLPGDASLPSSSKVLAVDPDEWKPKAPKVLMTDPQAVPLEMRSQIQMYATTEQISHPLVSPINQGSLGNLPPLYIIAGNEEVLRDEAIYLAHRAASPADYPVRKSAVNTQRQKENVTKFREPTKVHLQVFDDMPHVPTVFSFTAPAKYAYRSVAEFVKHVTLQTPEHVERNPFPELHRQVSPVSVRPKKKIWSLKGKRHIITQAEDHTLRSDTIGAQAYSQNEERTRQDILAHSTSASIIYSEDTPDVGMIRQRVNIHGEVRLMEPADEIPALQIRPSEIGLIKEGPTRKWLEGQEEWDRKFKRQAHIVLKRRKQFEARSARLLQIARDQGLLLKREETDAGLARVASPHSVRTTDGAIQEDRRWGPLDLADETPPRSAICNRRDTPEAYALLKKHIFWAAPSTHLTVPKQNVREAIRASFDPRDDPLGAPKQSVSEEQHRAHLIPIHGLRLWDAILSILSRKSAAKAMRSKERTAEAFNYARDRIENSDFIHARSSRESNGRHR